jgi:protocatechuate 3,4-dioxygenase beta subunit
MARPAHATAGGIVAAWLALATGPMAHGAHVLTLAAADEPGQRLTLAGRVLARDGAPIAGARLHIYQADSSGRYTRERPMDEPHARLAGYVTSDSAGRFELHSIRPGGYPKPLHLGDRDRHIPAHIHVDIDAAGHASRRLQVVFADDSLLADPYWQDWVKKLGQPVVEPRRAQSVWHAELKLVLD